MTIEQVMLALYDSEINCRIESFWDGGFTAYLGDEMNGFKADETFNSQDQKKNLDDAAKWMDAEARRLWPNSEYARGTQPLRSVADYASGLPAGGARKAAG